MNVIASRCFIKLTISYYKLSVYVYMGTSRRCVVLSKNRKHFRKNKTRIAQSGIIPVRQPFGFFFCIFHFPENVKRKNYNSFQSSSWRQCTVVAFVSCVLRCIQVHTYININICIYKRKIRFFVTRTSLDRYV